MGLIDGDHSNHEDRQRPFSPPPRHSVPSTLVMVLIFFAILVALYKLPDWKPQQQAALPVWQPPAAKASTVAIPTAEPAAQAFPPQPHESTKAGAAAQRVTKCVTHGKTSYGDGPCAPGSTVSQIVTRSDHNLIAGLPPRSVTTAAPTDEPSPNPRATVAQTSPVVDAAAAKKAECQLLNARIAELDALSRQPQSAQTQDWIRDERKKARDRQFRLSCG